MEATANTILENTTLEKSFTAYLLIKGAGEGGSSDAPNGDKYLHGPAALVEEDGLGSDFDGDDLTKAAVTEGLKEFERLGGQVDWDHLYSKSHRAAHLIGKCVGIQVNPEGGAPIVTTQLFMKKAFAREAWEHYECGGILGYSLQGVAKAGIAKGGGSKGKRVTALGIHMMTLTPMPKGYEGPRVTGGLPQSLGSMMKGLNAELEAGDTDGWERVEEIEKAVEEVRADDIALEAPVKKSFTTGSGVVQAGDTGGSTLRTQDLAGAKNGCKCQSGCKCRKRKKKPVDLLEPMAKSVMNKALVAELRLHGAGNAGAVAQAIAKAVRAPQHPDITTPGVKMKAGKIDIGRNIVHTKKEHALWLEHHFLNNPKSSPQTLKLATEARDHALGKRPSVSSSNHLSYPEIIAGVKRGQAADKLEASRQSAMASGKPLKREFEKHGRMFFGPDHHDTSGTGFRPAIARVDVAGHGKRFLTGTEEGVRAAASHLKEFAGSTGSLPETHGAGAHKVVIHKTQVPADKAFESHKERVAGFNAEARKHGDNNPSGVLTPEMQKLFGK